MSSGERKKGEEGKRYEFKDLGHLYHLSLRGPLLSLVYKPCPTEVLGAYFFLCAQEPLLARFREPHGILGTKPRFTLCKESALTVVLSFRTGSCLLKEITSELK